eukprot:19285-Heterococcus_DN1.PRE.3
MTGRLLRLAGCLNRVQFLTSVLYGAAPSSSEHSEHNKRHCCSHTQSSILYSIDRPCTAQCNLTAQQYT